MGLAIRATQKDLYNRFPPLSVLFTPKDMDYTEDHFLGGYPETVGRAKPKEDTT